MRIFKGILKVAAVLVFACLVNTAVTFALEPYGSKSEVMWTDYRQQDDLDMVFVGTSLAERAFDPTIIDQELGTNSFNMATPGQWIEESELALRSAVDKHSPDVVVFGFEYCDVQGDKFPDPGRAFLRNKNKGDVLGVLYDTAYCLTNERCYTEKSSINWLFPWISNHVKLNPSAIANNVKMKLDGTTVYEAAVGNEKGWTYVGRGYGNYEVRLDYNEGKSEVYADTYGHRNFDEQKLATLVSMCDYCEERGINFLVVAPPIPAFNVFEYGSKYFAQSEQLRALIEEHGGEYYDLSLARPELLDASNPDYFADFQHLNAAGGEAASQAFVKLMEARETGADLDTLFYSQEEYHQAHGFIDFVLLEAIPVEGGIQLEAEALAGKNVEVEYQMCVKNNATGEWDEVRGWSTDPEYLFALENPGAYQFRVNVREVGSDVQFDRYRLAKATV